MKRMIDSITPTDIPVNDPTTGRPWDYVLGYVDGKFGPGGIAPNAWTAAAWARFPNSTHVRCAVLASTLDADVLDRENGDATAAEAVAWVRAKRARGDAEPTVYVGLAEWGALQAAFTAAGVAHPHYGVAAYPGAGMVQEVLNGITSAFHQYADPVYGPGGHGSGGHFDLSVVTDGWLTQEADMTPDQDALLREIRRRVTSMQSKGFLQVTEGEVRAEGGDLGWVQQQLAGSALAKDVATLKTMVAALATPPPATVDQASLAAALSGYLNAHPVTAGASAAEVHAAVLDGLRIVLTGGASAAVPPTA